MLRAVNTGCEQFCKLFLSRRRWIRRLQRFSLARMLGSTRNPSRVGRLQKRHTLLNPGNAERFRVLSQIFPRTPGRLAYSGTRSPANGAARLSVAKAFNRMAVRGHLTLPARRAGKVRCPRTPFFVASFRALSSPVSALRALF